MKLFFILFSFTSLFVTVGANADQEITIVNHEFEGTKQWVPGTIVAYKGEKVTITLINNVPSGVHGFFIPDFNQRVDVKKGEKKTITFVADKAGIFPMKCHLHPAHVGGQFLVLDRPQVPTSEKKIEATTKK
jgi:heme/copper-type cytochrome/quinol oxidase subunit 2